MPGPKARAEIKEELNRRSDSVQKRK